MSSFAAFDWFGIESTIHDNFDAVDRHNFQSKEVNQRLLKDVLSFPSPVGKYPKTWARMALDS